MTQPQFELELRDAGATQALGAALARTYATAARDSQVLYLSGELGAGKTTCVRSLLRTLGVDGLIRSPTYTLVEAYETQKGLCVHVDLYRLQGALEVEELGLRDFLDRPCLFLVEWPEKGGPALAAPDIELSLRYDGNARRASLQGRSPAGSGWLDLLARDTSLTPYVSHLT